MNLIINIIILIALLINFSWYWIVLRRNFPQISKNTSTIFLLFLMIILYSIPVLNMRFLANKTYFQDLWIGFIVLGGIFVVLGVIIFKKTLEISSEYDTFIGKFQVLNKGMYEVVRHPIYLSIILMFIGLSFVFDSVLAIILIPFIIILFEVQAYYEEKILFMEHCEEEYKIYKEKTPKRLMVPSPLNVFLIIIGFFVIYLGMVNFESIFS